MRLKLVAAAAAGLALAWTGSEAAELQDFQVNTVDELATLCGVVPTDELYVDAIQFCYGYITGAVQFHNAMVRAGTIKRPIVCPPPDATRAEFAQYFSTWARTKATSEQLAEAPLEGATRAAAEKYPCPR
jgi:hypothetical protein